MEINYPQTRQMSDGEQFAEVFRQNKKKDV